MVNIRGMGTEQELQRSNGRPLFSNNVKNMNMDYRVHPLYHNNICQWAGCDTQCHTVPEFLEHILISHGLNDRSTAQCRVQTQVVSYLEAQLKKERERLSAMMAHLHTLPSKSLSISSIVSLNQQFPESPPSPPRQEYISPIPNQADTVSPGLSKLNKSPELSRQDSSIIFKRKSPIQIQSEDRIKEESSSPVSLVKQHSPCEPFLQPVVTSTLHSTEEQLVSPSSLSFTSSLTNLTSSSLSSLSSTIPSLSNLPNGLPSLPSLSGMYDTMLPRLPLPLPTPVSATSPTHYEGTNGECKLRTNSAPTPGSILANAALYQNPNVKPPFTYASLIREAIISSPNQRMSLNEIYTWFSQTFAFFRYNNSQWKNAVRHNLSLHKCFQRVEGPVGSGWTVNEDEFQLRRANRVNAVRSMEEEQATLPQNSNYFRSLQEHMFRLQEQILSDNNDEERLGMGTTKNTTPKSTCDEDPLPTSQPGALSEYYWSKIPNLGHIAEELLKSTQESNKIKQELEHEEKN